LQEEVALLRRRNAEMAAQLLALGVTEWSDLAPAPVAPEH
jgi:hypothetical protein